MSIAFYIARQTSYFSRKFSARQMTGRLSSTNFLMKRICIIILLPILLFISCETNDVPQPEPTVTLSLDLPVINEDQGKSILTVTMSNITEEDVTVNLSATGTAMGMGTDYTISSLSFNIPSGSLSATATINTVQDSEQEGNETILLAIESVTGAKEDGVQEITLIIEDDDVAAQANLILNEICYDPSNSGLVGDTNGDGAYAQAEDEFVELVNLSSASIDVSGYAIYDLENLAINTPNHTIPAGTVIPPGGVLVIFGGGTPTGSFGGAIVQTSTTGNMNLNNAGDIFYLYDASGNEVLSYDIEPLSNNPNESYTRNPDLTGDFVQHSDANAALLFSPGTKIDGSAF